MRACVRACICECVYVPLSVILIVNCHAYLPLARGDIIHQSGYVVVEPDLRLPDGSSLSLDSVSMQTVMSSMLGSLSTWRSRMRVAHESGYNMMHFSPIQQLGASQSGWLATSGGSLWPAVTQMHVKSTSLICSNQIVSTGAIWNCLRLRDISKENGDLHTMKEINRDCEIYVALLS